MVSVFSESKDKQCPFVAPRGFQACKAVKSKDALRPSAQEARCNARKLWLKWGDASSGGLQRMSVDAGGADKWLRSVVDDVVGLRSMPGL